MSSPRIVGPGQLGEVEDALAQGRIVALPGDGGYQVAVRHDHPGAFAMLRTHGAPASAVGQIVVGHRTQAAALTTAWSRQTAHLTDRMWPGPLTVVLTARPDEAAPVGSGDPIVQLTMPAWRPLRTLVRRTGPLAVMYLQGTDGGPVVSAEDVRARLIPAADPGPAAADVTAGEVVFIVDGGPRRGPTSTVVDCTSSPPRVLHAGALPESYVEAALLMGGRRRGLFTRRNVDDKKT